MSGPNPSVLLVDDVEANLVALEALLEDLPCELVRAEGGNEALRQLLKRDFAVMLLDVQMPEMDGYEVARYARENQATRDVPIIFLTALHDGGDAALRAYGSGAVDFLLKPVNPHVLRAKVNIFLELYLSRRTLADEVSAHKRTLDALEQANGALRHFTHAASHDLRAPLNVIRGFLDALDERLGSQLDAEARSYVTRILAANERMISLVNSLLIYAGLQKPVALTDVDCKKVVEQVLDDQAERIAGASAVVTVGALPVVVGDSNRLYQLFLNLVGNAIKFRRPAEPPRIEVRAEERRGEWLFWVEDDGIGVDLQYSGVIFDAFRRLHSPDDYQGTGLGLTICQQIVEQHGGRIWFEAAPGGGSRFCFTLHRSAPLRS